MYKNRPLCSYYLKKNSSKEAYFYLENRCRHFFKNLANEVQEKNEWEFVTH